MKLGMPIYAVAGTVPLEKRYDGEGGGAGSGAETGITIEEVRTLLKEEFMPTINTGINNAVANLKKGDVPKLIETALGPVQDQMASIVDKIDGLSGSSSNGNEGGGGSKDMSPEMKAKFNEAIKTSQSLTERVATLEQQKKEADDKLERAQQDKVLSTALSSFTFQDRVAADSAFTLLRPDVKRLDDGTIVAGDDLPVEDYVKDVLPARYGFLLKPKDAGGTGARGSQSPGSGARGHVQMEDIKPGMSPEEREKAAAEILSQLS